MNSEPNNYKDILVNCLMGMWRLHRFQEHSNARDTEAQRKFLEDKTVGGLEHRFVSVAAEIIQGIDRFYEDDEWQYSRADHWLSGKTE